MQLSCIQDWHEDVELFFWKQIPVCQGIILSLDMTHKSRIRKLTMHNGASNEIKEIKVCKKCPKVKPYCAPIFDPIVFKPFLDDA